jgi:hypothetical protein
MNNNVIHRCVSFPVDISNIEIWIEEFFSGKEPFKLLKTSSRKTNDKEGFVVRAVSLIDGSKYFFEIYEDVMCIYFENKGENKND